MVSKKTFFVSCIPAMMAASLIAADSATQIQKSSQNEKLQIIQTSASPSINQNSSQQGYISVNDMMDMMAARQARIMDQMMNDAFYIPQNNVNIRSSGSYPQSNFITKDDKYIFQFAVPGISKKDINIKVENKLLSVSYKVSKQDEEKNGDGSDSYKSYTSQFQRCATIPSDVDADKISSSYKDGILSIYLPRIESAKHQSKVIAVE